MCQFGFKNVFNPVWRGSQRTTKATATGHVLLAEKKPNVIKSAKRNYKIHNAIKKIPISYFCWLLISNLCDSQKWYTNTSEISKPRKLYIKAS